MLLRLCQKLIQFYRVFKLSCIAASLKQYSTLIFSKTGSHAGQAPFPEKDANMSLVSECHENSLSASGEETVAGHKSSIESDDNTIDNEIQTTTVLSGTVRPQNPQTSTPLRQDITVDLNSVTGAVGFSPVSRKNTGSSDSTGSSVGSSERPIRRSKRVSFIDPVNVRVPLVGFEVMEQRAKFTVSGREMYFRVYCYTLMIKHLRLNFIIGS